MVEKNAVVTGASRGIGRACAIGLASLGYRVALIARSGDALAAVQDEIAQLDGSSETMAFAIDVTNDLKIAHVIEQLRDRFVHVDVFVNNAGIDIDGTLDLPVEDYDRLLHTNLRAPFVMLRELLPLMLAAPGPYVFNVASRAGKVGFARDGGYVSTKFGLVGLNESIYRDFADKALRTTAICPGWVNTDMARSPKCPLEPDEMIQVEDIFSTLEWLLSLSPQTCIKEVVIECKKSIA